ncbi:DUF6233 domain-containing protein [Streptomyces sp. NPDC059477]|uniref:DUF6233 domain-containing protein n=1 Tax=Streptomyces sp. NPDC059477 TaxID=3346847 RepID=UPI003692FAC3
MSDLPPDLPRLRTLETWLVYSLDRVRRQIADLERREAERQRGERRRLPPPDWLVDPGPSGVPPPTVHAGECWAMSKQAVRASRAAALQALTEGAEACTVCRPDTALGIME